MKNERAYSQLKRKIFGQTLAMVSGALFLVLLLRSLARGRFGDMLVNLIAHWRHITIEDALVIYDQIIRPNISNIILIVIIVFLLLFFYFSLSWFSKYFDAIAQGVNALAEESQGPITLCPELGFMADQLNQIKDVLAQRAVEAQAAEQRKNDLVVYLAHDLKTPLTSVIGYLSLLAEQPDIPPDLRAKYIGVSLSKANRLEELINEFFDITRFNLQEIKPQRQTLALDFMLAQIVEEQYPQWQAKGQRVEIKAPEGLTYAGDGPKLARVFGNLLRNAIAYAWDNSVITITAAAQENGLITVTFANQGENLTPQELEKIFIKFYRLDEARSASTGGAGLGLAIAQEIVKAHGGAIAAQSQNNLTQFTVTLPPGPGPMAQTH